MKIFTNKNLIQKLIIAIVAVTLLNFCIAPMQVQAAGPGGWLANGIRDLALILPDAAISIAQLAITGTYTGAVDGGGSAETNGDSFWQEKPKYPIIQISPELIFSNEIELLSIDFIGDSGKDYIIPANNVIGKGAGEQNTGKAISILRTIIATWYVTLRTLAIVGLLSVLVYIGIRIIISSTSQDKAKYKQRLMDWVVAFCLLFFMHYIMAGIVTVVNRLDTALASSLNVGSGIPLNTKDYGTVKYNNNLVKETADATDQAWGMTADSEEERAINAAKEWLANNGYNNVTAEPYTHSSQGAESFASGIKLSRDIGNGKSEYAYIYNQSQKVGDWHFGDPFSSIFNHSTSMARELSGIVSYINDTSNGKIPVTNTASTSENGNTSTVAANSSSGIDSPGKDSLIKDATMTTTTGGKPLLVSSTATLNNGQVDKDGNEAGSTILYYINYARLYCNASSDHNPEGFGFTMIYIILVVMTVMFLFRYLKRVIYVAFLTLIAPLVALTYPIDKIKDGKAQAFNMWIREYIFNVLIQPFHLLIYGILVGGASALANAYWIYGVVCIAFLIPAEKLLRKFFGFDNAGTLSAAGSFAGGALFSTMLNRINRPKPKGGPGGEGKKDIKMNRAPNSSGRVDADATLTGAGNNAQQATANATAAAQARRTRRGNSTGTDADRVNRAAAERYANLNITSGAPGSTGATGSPGSSGTPGSTGTTGSSGSSGTPGSTGTTGSPGSSGIPGSRTSLGRENVVSRWGRLSGTGMTFGDYMSLSGSERRDAWKKGTDKREKNAANVADAVVGDIKEKAIKGAKTLPKTAGRMARRAVVGGMAGGALALTGAAVGAASGDAGAAMKLATAGAAAGYYGANYYGDKLAKSAGETTRVADEAFWNEQNKARNQYLADEEFKHSEENVRMLAQFQGSMEQARESMGNGDVQAFLNEGFNDSKKIGRGLKLMEKYQKQGLTKDKALERAISVVKWSDSAGAGLYETNSLAQQKFIANTKKQVMAGKGITEEQAEQEVRDIINDMAYVRFGV